MKKLRKLHLNSQQVLTFEEQNSIVAGQRKVFLGVVENCHCTKVGNTHDRLTYYRTEPSATDYICGYIEYECGLLTTVGSIYTAAQTGGTASYFAYAGAVTGIMQSYNGINKMLPHVELTRDTFRCTSAKNGRATSHSFFSTETIIL